ncbi:TPA: tryptophan synthase subunit alpha, partial [Candidatus Poribacteria bacterium]|nr:tryptophan synthase subunit alpha [Candidatus Poribacteria bacterium]
MKGRGVERVGSVFEKLRLEGKTAFIPYICAGDPSLDVTRRLVLALERAGSDMLELGVPFSDPIADGPTIQRATGRALRAGA